MIATGHAHLQPRSKRGTVGSGPKLQEGGAHQGLVRATGTHNFVLGLGSAKVIHLVICGALTSTPLCLQPNRRLLLNYGIVTDDNPHDKCAYSDRAPLNPFCCPCRSALSLPGPAESFQAVLYLKVGSECNFRLERGQDGADCDAAACGPSVPGKADCAPAAQPFNPADIPAPAGQGIVFHHVGAQQCLNPRSLDCAVAAERDAVNGFCFFH